MTAEAMTDYSGFVRREKDGRNCLWLAVDGMSCAGCAFKIEKALNANENVEARVNVTEKRLSLAWSGDKSAGNILVDKAARLGFRFSPVKEKNDGEQEHLRFLMRCMAVSGFASGNIMVFSLALWFTTRDGMGGSTRDLMHWYSALIALPSVMYAGLPFFRSAWGALRRWQTNMDVPISLAVILSCAMSLFETVRGGEYVYFDSATMLLFLLLVGRYFDAKARGHARAAASDLLSLMSGTASVVQDGGYARIPSADIKPDMTLLVARGERILADGVLLEDADAVDTSAITGETLPRPVKAGERVLAGMMNVGNPLRLRVEKTQGESLMNDIIRLMQKAEQGNAVYVRAADRIARWYTPVVHILALMTFLGWWVYGGAPWQTALLYAVTVLIITCPCALGLAVPVVQVIAGGRLFRKGMLLKSADALERLEKTDTVIFDKTGTLTTGEISFTNKADFSNDELSLMASLASCSRHPLARAVSAVEAVQVSLKTEEIAGKGMEAEYEGQKIRLGSASFVGAESAAEDDRQELWFKKGQMPPKRLVFSDSPHADAADVITALKKNYRVIMLSGDRPAVAADVARKLGIEDFRAGVDPKEKLNIIEEETKKGHHVLMVGDGLNDAPSLTLAGVSMSPSSALDIAQNSADIVYQAKGISSVAQALETARRAQRMVRQNFAMAFLYNAAAIPLAMAGLVTPLIAAIAMSASSLAVIGNALRLKGD